ncbi:MAG TPA: efflux transporter outer membrane subunit [Alcaligenes sp.]|nr:efflux transporter outer membrane subunit [Alcaligenes sp.]HRL27773.1 efflux transporter outer membrane subunit [Alcaligenes sp.]
MRVSRWTLAMLGGLLQACAPLSPNIDVVLPALPPAYEQGDPGGARDGVVLASEWWRAFGSDGLDVLMQQAVTQAAPLQQAQARVLQARAQARMAGVRLWPELEGSVSAQRQAPFESRHGPARSDYVAGLVMRYELDVWGRNAALADSATAQAQAAAYELDVLRVSVQGEVAYLWLQMLGDRHRLRIARDNLAVARRLLALLEARSQAGAASPLELAQQRGLLASQQRALHGLEAVAVRNRLELSALLGQAQVLPEPQDDILTLHVPSVQTGLPSALLGQRPDIARLEARLVAAQADLRAARAALYPSLTLGASAGARGDHWRKSLEHPVYSLLSGLVAPIFNAGRLQADAQWNHARLQELLAEYRQGVVQAYVEVEDVLAQLRGIDAQALANEQEWTQARLALNLAETRYRAGSETLLTLLDAQRSFYAAQDLRVQLTTNRLQARADLFRALGGGWQAPGA